MSVNCIETESHKTLIQRFYAGQSVFITGSTGFLGSALIEKLLRSCPDIFEIYLLIRPKKNKDPEVRLNELFESPLYSRLKKEVPYFRKKVIPIVGDLSINDLGLSENDKNILMRKVSIVFHVAANVRLNESIKINTISNVIATCEVFNIVKCMTNLKSFIWVSTVFSQYHFQRIEERFYTCPINYEKLIEWTNTVPENKLNKLVAKNFSEYINNYLITKAVMEAFFENKSENIPMGIFRPGIVTPSANEPITGWTDNYYGPTWMTIHSMLGYLRVHNGDDNVRINIIPVDITINALIASAWDVFNQQSRRGKDMLIYNCLPQTDMPTWRQYFNILYNFCEKYPCKDTVWLPHTIFFRQKIIYIIYSWLCHLLPAFLVDTARVCMGRRPKMWKFYKKIHRVDKLISPFTFYERIINSNNVEAMWNNMCKEDQQLFQFDMKTFDWPTYLINYYKGIRLYLLNEDKNSDLQINRSRYRRLYWMQQIFRIVFILIALGILWKIFANVFG